jgi:hypothetical protein
MLWSLEIGTVENRMEALPILTKMVQALLAISGTPVYSEWVIQWLQRRYQVLETAWERKRLKQPLF